jgi:hypothetical protein
LTDVFIFAASAAHAGTFIYTLVTLPLEDSEGSEANSTLLAVVLFEHPHVRVISIAAIAGNRKI